MSREKLEQAVIDTVLKHYEPYHGPKGLKLLVDAITATLGDERSKAIEKQADLMKQLEQIDATAKKLLDNLTPTNRSFIDRRLAELSLEADQLQVELKSCAALAVSEEHIQVAAKESHAFIEQLPDVLRGDDPYQRVQAIRACVTSIQLAADTCTFSLIPSLAPANTTMLHCFRLLMASP